MTAKEKSSLQKEIIAVLQPGQSGRLLLAPRIGKSKIILDLIKRDKIKGKILWVTPSSELANTAIPSEFSKWRATKYLSQLVTTTWAGLSKCKGQYDLIVLDEEQFMTSNNAINLISGELSGKQILSMTGTETKSKDKQELYDSLNLEILYELSINEAVDIGLLANYDIKVVLVELDPNKNIEIKYKDKQTKEEKSFMTSEQKQYEYLCRSIGNQATKMGVLKRRRIIGTSRAKVTAAKYILNSLEGRRLIFTHDSSQAEELCDYTYHSKTSDTYLKQFMSGEIEKIAMVNKGGTGYTYERIDHLILVQTDSDNNGLTSQKLSRTLLGQKNYKATIWILCLKDTKDMEWLASTLNNFDSDKIRYLDFKNLVL